MAVTTLAPQPTFNIGRVINRMAGTIGRNLVPFALLACLPSVALGAAVLAAGPLSDGQGGFAKNLAPSTAIELFAVVGVSGLAWFFLTYLLQAAIVHGTVLDLNGKRASGLDMLKTGFGQALPIIGLVILQGLGTGLAFLLLIVPGFIVMTSWAVVVPVRIVERIPILDCFGRSSQLTAGHRWAVFGLFVIYAFVSSIIQSAAQLVAGVAGTGSVIATVLAIAATIVETIATSVLLSAGIASLYYELRWIKEGTDPEQLAAVFD